MKLSLIAMSAASVLIFNGDLLAKKFNSNQQAPVVSSSCQLNKLGVNTQQDKICTDGGGGGGGTATTFHTNVLRVECESFGYGLEECKLPQGRTGVTLHKVYSESTCDNQWSVNGDILSVTNGCRAWFDVQMSRTVKVLEFSCDSIDRDYKSCFHYANQISSPWVNDRYSNNYCHNYINWGETENAQGINIWVNDGCRAKFNVLIN